MVVELFNPNHMNECRSSQEIVPPFPDHRRILVNNPPSSTLSKMHLRPPRLGGRTLGLAQV